MLRSTLLWFEEGSRGLRARSFCTSFWMVHKATTTIASSFHPAFAQLAWRGIYECILCEPGDFCNGCDTFTRPNAKNCLSLGGCPCASSPSIAKGVLTTRNRRGKGPGPLSQSVFEASLVPNSLHSFHAWEAIFIDIHSGFTHLPWYLSIGP